MGYLVASCASEEHNIVQMMAYGAVDGHTQSVDGVFGCEYSHKKTLSNSQLCADVFRPVETDRPLQFKTYDCLTQDCIFVIAMVNHTNHGRLLKK